MNGNREQGNAFLLDGISVDETIDNRIGYKPNIDAIAEFKIETSNSSAEFGNVTGATVNATLKSGTNQLRGNVFEFFRNDGLDANSWSNNRSSAPKQKLEQNIFGGTIGGPIVKNKIFFFGDYQGTRQATGGGTTATVAPLEWRLGDLSSLTTPIIDPTTGQQFPGNRIPINRIVNPAARALFADPALYPLPTRPGTTNITGNYVTSFDTELEGDQFDVKIDARLTNSDNFSGRYSFGNFNTNGIRGTLPTNLTGTSFNRPQNVALNWTRIISPTMVNEARIGMNRAVFITDVLDWYGLGDGNATLGIPGGQAKPGLSSIAMGNGVSNIGSTAVIEDNVTNTFHYGDTLTINRNRHLMKMGGQWLRYQQNRFYPGNNGLLGLFDSTGTFTGAAYADFLLDLLARKGLGSNSGTWGHRQNRIGLFFQDDFKMRSNLTWILGIRWEYTSPVYEVHDRQSNFDIVTGQQFFAGQDGNSRALYEPYYKGFEPRLGFAWTPTMFEDRLVVRGGYGITQVHGGDRLEPAPAAQPAVLLRGGHQFRQIVRRRHDQPWLHRRHRSRSAGGTHPGMESRSATAIHPAVEPHVRVRGGALHRCHARLRRQQGDAPGCPDRLEPAAPGNGSTVDVDPLPAAAATLRGAPARDADQRHRLVGDQQLPRDAGEPAAAVFAGARVHGLVHVEQDHDRQPRVLRQRRRGGAGRILVQQLQSPRAELRPGVLRRHAQHHELRHLRASLWTRPAEYRLERTRRRGARRLERRRHRQLAHRIPDNRDCNRRFAAEPARHVEAQPDRQRRTGRSNARSLARRNRVRHAAAGQLRRRRRRDRPRAQGTSTWMCPSARSSGCPVVATSTSAPSSSTS